MAVPGVERQADPGSRPPGATLELAEDVAMAVPRAGLTPVRSPGRLAGVVRSARTWTTVGGIRAHGFDLVWGRACPPIRRARCEGRARWVKHLPAGWRTRFDLDAEVVDPLRVEIGGGSFPSPGYVHVDVHRRSRHVEHVAQASSLPFGDGTVQELLAVHILEHVHASDLLQTLREWRRVLRPGGFAQIHVPDAANVFTAFLEAPPEHKWTIMIPIFGMTSHVRFPRSDAADRERHHVIYDFALLERVLLDAGFARVEDVSDEVTDRHSEKWRDDGLIPRMSLIVRAFAVPESTG